MDHKVTEIVISKTVHKSGLLCSITMKADHNRHPRRGWVPNSIRIERTVSGYIWICTFGSYQSTVNGVGTDRKQKQK